MKRCNVVAITPIMALFLCTGCLAFVKTNLSELHERAANLKLVTILMPIPNVYEITCITLDLI